MNELIEKMKENRFAIENVVAQKRTGNYGKQAKIAEKWLVFPESIRAGANLERFFQFNGQKFELVEDKFTSFLSKGLPISMTISAPLAFYRLICVFKTAPLVEKDGYKTLAAFPLQHRDSENYIEFNDYKGAFGLHTHFSEPDQLPANFKKDLLELLNFLTSNEVAHTYDKTVAGSVA